MNTLKVKNTYEPKLAGAPSHDVLELASSGIYSVSPAAIPYLKPKLMVKEGDVVHAGQALFYDKTNEKVVFVSPIAGSVEKIVFGKRRVISELRIKSQGDLLEDVSPVTVEDLSTMSRDSLLELLLKLGCFPYFQAFPFRKIPDPSEVPPAIYLSLHNDEPFHPSSAVLLKDKREYFEFGLDILKKLSEKVVVSAKNNMPIPQDIKKHVSVTVKGAYPASDPGVVLYHTKTSAEENRSWSIELQHLLSMAELLLTGKFPKYQLMVVAGSAVQNPKHIRVPFGAPIESILEQFQLNTGSHRVIAGGVFTGRKIEKSGALSPYETAIHVLTEGKESEFMSFLRLGFDKQSFSRTYLSALLPNKEWSLTASLNGSERDCISCQHCEAICPVELMPEQLLKNLKGGDSEEAVRLGLLDCTDCGLCTYVCPSKIELGSTFITAKTQLHKELTA